ncbi:MAG: TonB-dependent receptor [Bacteroidota bacterium]|nr:TonB-dependent receptor [Bacteroidota bacterium]
MKSIKLFNKSNRTYSKVFSVAVLGIVSTTIQAQEQPKDSITDKYLIDEVLVEVVRATDKTPVSFSNITNEEIKSRNLGQDIPTMINFMPSVVTTSDAGNGIGYSGIRVRGTDATRVNVTINGVPYNDSESHGTFWVNLPDLVSSVENIQLQRGVGTSTNGSGAFGASLNLLTDAVKNDANVEIANSVGSYNTRKHTLKFSTGKIADSNFELSGRLSNIKSDGYIDRAWVDMKSYFLQGAYSDNTTLIKALVFGGDQKTYQAWNGLEDEDKLKDDRTYNIAGEMYDSDGNLIGFYNNETDNYKQDLYQLHWNERYNNNWSTNVALHYTKGKGYYENYKGNQKLSNYGIAPIQVGNDTIKRTDLVRQKWLDNHFYGAIFSANYKDYAWNIIFGGGWNKYTGDHFGNVMWMKKAPVQQYPIQYYFDSSEKTDLNFFAKVNYQITNRWNVFVDMQYRTVHYMANGQETGMVDDTFKFFNPKAGITYTLNQYNNLYVSYARANREPNRNDYKEGNPKPETLNDFELGWRYKTDAFRLNVNAYYMRYDNQLVLTGALNDVGAPIRENSGNSYRAGLEVEYGIALFKNLFLNQNFTISKNKNIDFYAERDGVLQNFGNTNIAFSPEVIFSSTLTYSPFKNMNISLLSKYVGEQYMSNLDLKQSKLKSYSVNDLNVSYSIFPKRIFQEIRVSGIINNIMNEHYISNGFFYSFDDNWSDPNSITTIDGAGYFPQATRNFLVGLSLIF